MFQEILKQKFQLSHEEHRKLPRSKNEGKMIWSFFFQIFWRIFFETKKSISYLLVMVGQDLNGLTGEVVLT